MLVCRILVLASICIYKNATAQLLADSSILNKSETTAIEAYHSALGIQSSLYNGVEHVRYPSTIEGFAYFLTSDWQMASVNYDGIIYTDIPVQYDLVRDEVIIQHPSRIPIIPSVAKIKGFSLPGHSFVRIEKQAIPSLKTGFYEQFIRGPITVLIKREKTIDEKINGLQLERKFILRERYYIVKENEYHPVGNEKDLLKVLKERRNEIKQYLSDNSLRFGTDPDNTIIKAVEYYNQLNSR
jgi:hypothetical protein